MQCASSNIDRRLRIPVQLKLIDFKPEKTRSLGINPAVLSPKARSESEVDISDAGVFDAKSRVRLPERDSSTKDIAIDRNSPLDRIEEESSQELGAKSGDSAEEEPDSGQGYP